MGGRAERLYRRSYGEPLSRGNKERASKNSLLVYAGASQRRLSFLTQALDIPVIQVPGGDESTTEQDSMVIMKGKLKYGKTEVQRKALKGEIDPTARLTLVAADTVSRPYYKEQGALLPQTQQKPDQPDQTRQLLGKMRRDSAGNGRPPIYHVDSSSGVETLGSRPNCQRMLSTIELDPKLIRHFGTPEGFRDYQALFDEFHRSPLYTNGGQHRPVTVNDASGGFSLPVFMLAHAVKSVDHVKPGDKGFEDVVFNANYTAFIGIHPGVLRRMQPNIDQRIADWEWGRQITAFTMQAAA